jgi:hypothetical protein
VQDAAENIVIETGAARFELPKKGPLLGRVTAGQTVVAPGGLACLLVTDQRGRTGDELQSAAPAVEYQGQQFAVVRREGLLRTAAGETLGRYVVRLEFMAGRAAVKMQHSFIVTEDTTKTQFGGLAVRVATVRGDRHATFAADALLEEDLRPGETAYLAQTDYWHHGQKTSTREMKLGTVKVEQGAAGEPKAMGDWAAVQTGGRGVLVAIPNAAKLFPKEFEVTADALVAHLWSSRGGRLLDYRPSTLVDHWGVAWVDKMYPGGSKAMRAIEANGQGSARTHDLWLPFFAPESVKEMRTIGALCTRQGSNLQPSDPKAKG